MNTMKKDYNTITQKSDEEVISLTQHTFNDFTVQELEERLETDPFLLSNLFALSSDDGHATTYGSCGCKKIGECPTLKCGCDGGFNPPPPCNCNIVNLSCPELDIDVELK